MRVGSKVLFFWITTFTISDIVWYTFWIDFESKCSSTIDLIDLFKIKVVSNWSEAQKIHFHGQPRKVCIELNGRKIYDDGEKELARIREMMSSTYELPPLDMIG